MFGNIANRELLLKMIEQKRITIRPFELKKLRTIHYPLTAGKVLHNSGNSSSGKVMFEVKHDFEEAETPYKFAPNEYAIVKVKESVSVAEGIVGHFVPSSDFVDFGFQLTAGRVEFPFGANNEQLQFGVRNALDRQNELSNKLLLAYIYFVDLSGLGHEQIQVPDSEKARIARKDERYFRANDDGPFHE